MSNTDWEVIDKNRKEIKKATIPELESLAFEESKRNDNTNYHIFRDILWERKYRLDKEFVFTPEYIEKFLWLDQEIKKYVNILREKGEKMLENLERITKDENSFFNDYEIECIIRPQIPIWDDDGELKEEDKILEAIDSFHYKHHSWMFTFDPCCKYSCYFDKEDEDILNWNITIRKWRELIEENPELAKLHIGYGMHELYDHSLWALQDIMKINDFYCDLKVEYQKY
jgi:hypothetical protein